MVKKKEIEPKTVITYKQKIRVRPNTENIKQINAISGSSEYLTKLTNLENKALTVQDQYLGAMLEIVKRDHDLKTCILDALEWKIGKNVDDQTRRDNVWDLAKSNAWGRIFRSLEILTHDIKMALTMPSDFVEKEKKKLPTMSITEMIELKKQVKQELAELGCDPNVIDVSANEDE